MYLRLVAIALITSVFSSCEKEIDNPSVDDTPIYHPGTNFTGEEWSKLTKTLNISEEEFDYGLPDDFEKNKHYYLGTFGRALFYDTQLSSNGEVACASCHQQEFGFADNVDFSEGINGQLTKRNTIALGGSISRADIITLMPFFWDTRETSFYKQISETIQNPEEMGIDRKLLKFIIENERHYQVLRDKAFPNTEPDESQAIMAIARFMASIKVQNSKFDQAFSDSEIDGDMSVDFKSFSKAENLGKSLFLENCNVCHKASFQTSLSFDAPINANNGLDLEYLDQGVAMLTGKKSDEGVFKIPGLKNISLTAPYMHDGRFETLEEVVDFYNHGIQNHVNLDGRLKTNGEVKKMNLNANEKAALISFLETLTDEQTLVHEKWSDPFKR